MIDNPYKVKCSLNLFRTQNSLSLTATTDWLDNTVGTNNWAIANPDIINETVDVLFRNKENAVQFKLVWND